MAKAEFPELAKSADKAREHLSRYLDGPTKLSKATDFQKRVGDRDMYSKLAARRSQTGRFADSASGVLDKFRTDVSSGVGSRMEGAANEANIISDDINRGRYRQMASDAELSKALLSDAMNEQKAKLTQEQADAAKEAAKWKFFTGGLYAGGKSLQEDDDGNNFWDNLGGAFSSSGGGLSSGGGMGGMGGASKGGMKMTAGFGG